MKIDNHIPDLTKHESVLFPVQKTDIIAFSRNLISGMLVKTPKGRSKLVRKYPYLAHCENGCWSWIEIYLAENGVILSDRQVEISRNRANMRTTDNGEIKQRQTCRFNKGVT